MVPSWDKRGGGGGGAPIVILRRGRVSAILLSGAGFPVGGSSAARCGVAVLSCSDQH